jgi:hypothetical protein
MGTHLRPFRIPFQSSPHSHDTRHHTKLPRKVRKFNAWRIASPGSHHHLEQNPFEPITIEEQLSFRSLRKQEGQPPCREYTRDTTGYSILPGRRRSNRMACRRLRRCRLSDDDCSIRNAVGVPALPLHIEAMILRPTEVT